MKFSEIAQVFEEGFAGTDQFKELSKKAFQLMKSDPENAALYYVVGVAAHAYVMRYEDQGVDPELANRAKEVLVGFSKRIVAALPQDASQRLQTASAIAIDYEWNVREF
ncbi:MAG: hypothetical protein CVU24_01745 [Betaproteobacteria bacterium HGW-Betaproteobacteria-18]|nr:MAG: hypothetical protein CVU24_01745 [Betaproteobacteria bacterium HGW-Betaproteobacteria-18]